MIVLDTNIVSHLMASDPVVASWLEGQPPHETHTTSITRAEVRYGIARLPQGRRRHALARAADELFTLMAHRTLAFDNSAADIYGDLLAGRRAAGHPMSHEDAQIAAIAASRRATLVTRNIRDFQECGLALVDPFAG